MFFSNYSELVQSFIEGTTLLICIMAGWVLGYLASRLLNLQLKPNTNIYNGHIGGIPARNLVPWSLLSWQIGTSCNKQIDLDGHVIWSAHLRLFWGQGPHSVQLRSWRVTAFGIYATFFCNVLGVGRGLLCALLLFLMPKQRVNGVSWTTNGLHASIPFPYPLAVFIPFIAFIICFISLSCT